MRSNTGSAIAMKHFGLFKIPPGETALATLLYRGDAPGSTHLSLRQAFQTEWSHFRVRSRAVSVCALRGVDVAAVEADELREAEAGAHREGGDRMGADVAGRLGER